MPRHFITLTAMAVTAFAAQSAFGQLLYTNSADPFAYVKNVTTDVDTTVTKPGASVGGLSALVDTVTPANSRLYATQGSTLRTFDFSSTQLGSVTTTNIGNGDTITFNGLGYDGTRDVLWGVKQNTTNGASGLWSINRSTGVSTIFTNTGAAGNFVGADYYLGGDYVVATANNTIGGLAAGVYGFALGGVAAPVLLASYPSGITDVDGVAVIDNVAYLTLDEPGSVYRYDLLNGTYLTPLTSSISVDPGAGSGGAAFAPGFVPEPGSLALLGLGGLLGLRRRRAGR